MLDTHLRAEEMDHLRTVGELLNCLAPAANLDSVPWTHMAAHSCSSRESDTFWPLWAPAMQVVHRHTFGQNTHTHNRCQEQDKK